MSARTEHRKAIELAEWYRDQVLVLADAYGKGAKTADKEMRILHAAREYVFAEVRAASFLFKKPKRGRK
jgi:hypothetical protein